jgi:hypothetical protein
MTPYADDAPAWPALPWEAWQDTAATLHMWLQIVGKVRVACVPWVNHQWHVTLHLTARGLTSRPMPLPGSRPGGRPGGTFQIDMDFVDHQALVLTSEGGRASVELKPRSVADFHQALMGALGGVGIEVEIHGEPNEVADPIPFHLNERDGAYQADYANRFWRILASSASVMEDFRGGFVGKSSPVHFFWGGMDLAVTRFSGAPAPEHPGGIPHLPDWITREAYSHEVASAGFWAGGPSHPEAIFYAYAYPNPAGYPEAAVRPEAARWHAELSEFVLPYEAVRAAEAPADALMAFLDSTYEAAADLGRWDRKRLEWGPGERPPVGGLPG